MEVRENNYQYKSDKTLQKKWIKILRNFSVITSYEIYARNEKLWSQKKSREETLSQTSPLSDNIYSVREIRMRNRNECGDEKQKNVLSMLMRDHPIPDSQKHCLLYSSKYFFRKSMGECI